MAGMDARCRRLRAQPSASSSDNNTGKYREKLTSWSEEETDSGSLGGLSPLKISDAEDFREKRCLFSQKYPRRPPRPDGDGDVVSVGGLAVCWMLSSHWDCSLPNPRP